MLEATMGGNRSRAVRKGDSATLELDYETRDTRIFAVMRFALASAALIVIYIDPTEPRSKVELTYSTLAVYCVYSAAVLVASLHRPPGIDQRVLCAIDVVFRSGRLYLTSERAPFRRQSVHIALEGLSNIVRHTEAKQARIRVREDAGFVSVEIANEETRHVAESKTFVPGSIETRVKALGGVLEVRHDAAGYTVVQASIPA